MSRAGIASRSLFLALMVLVGTSLPGCGDDEASGTSTANSANPAFPINRASNGGPVIAGVASTTAVVGQPYRFSPQIANASTTVTFSIQNLPAWARFDTTTGTLSGTPNASQVGTYRGIEITLRSGMNQIALPQFTITVLAANSQAAQTSVTLSWQPPTENADGTPLVDLKGYRVHFGAKSKTYSTSIQVANPGLTTYVVQNLSAGQYYFAVTSYNSAGVESSLSPEVATMLD